MAGQQKEQLKILARMTSYPCGRCGSWGSGTCKLRAGHNLSLLADRLAFRKRLANGTLYKASLISHDKVPR